MARGRCNPYVLYNEERIAVDVNPNLPNPSAMEKLRERIYRYAASNIAREAAEDVVQEVMLVLHEKYSSVTRPEELVPLAIEIARFKVLGARRKMIRRGENTQVSVDDLPLASTGDDPFEQAARREQLEKLEGALAELGDRCRELFRLKLEGLTFAEIQKQLKVESLNTLYTWDFRCRKQLLEKMGGAWEKHK
ncbi:MAG: RNA polymerase sigma factor [Acidobacteriota bacterium]